VLLAVFLYKQSTLNEANLHYDVQSRLSALTNDAESDWR